MRKAQRATDKGGSVARWAFLFAIPIPVARSRVSPRLVVTEFSASERRSYGNDVIKKIHSPANTNSPSHPTHPVPVRCCRLQQPMVT
ncbi:hypothetical protein FF011L_34380 [Roseimaritima multifibrata]|uniref:Uncharacterized protein n=1 Tax=Roseimaritima multifibrata TaxID=1930274 RepID=A0A517MIH8_9BACT|nr:hypothetical protein FF011L_34380 [Roseimaritima multifibrata]